MESKLSVLVVGGGSRGGANKKKVGRGERRTPGHREQSGDCAGEGPGVGGGGGRRGDRPQGEKFHKTLAAVTPTEPART